MSEVSTKNSVKAIAAVKPVAVKGAAKSAVIACEKALTYEDVKPLLAKNTCSACHNPTTKQVGPAFKDVAKRNYSVAQIMALIKTLSPSTGLSFLRRCRRCRRLPSRMHVRLLPGSDL
jgi:cytochrome c551/c552